MKTNKLVPLRIEVSSAQLDALNYWAGECRATPETLLVSSAMEAIQMRQQSGDSHEDQVAMTVYALRDFVDNRKAPQAEHATLSKVPVSC